MKRIVLSFFLFFLFSFCLGQNTSAGKYVSNPESALADARKAISNGNYKEGFEVIADIIDLFGVRDALSRTEMKVYDGSAGQQGPVNVAWNMNAAGRWCGRWGWSRTTGSIYHLIHDKLQ